MVNSGAVSGNLSESDSEAKDRFPRGFIFIIFFLPQETKMFGSFINIIQSKLEFPDIVQDNTK